MKKLVSLVLTLAVIFGMVQAFGVQAAPEELVYIPDDYLRFELNMIGISTNGDGEATQSAMASITSLDVSHRYGISDLTGLEYAVNLTDLNLSNHQITDLSPLTELNNLKVLSLNNNQIIDISSLAGLSNLEELWLNSNKITDVTPLTALNRLKNLSLNGNQITSVSLVGLDNLERLSLGYNSTTDIVTLAGLTNLRTLYIYGNNIADISALSGLSNLETLNLYSNSITDISPIAGLTNLRNLELTNNNISDISPLLNLSKRTVVDLAENELNISAGSEDSTAWEDFKKLRDSGIVVRGITDQKILPNPLPTLEFSDNKLRDALIAKGADTDEDEKITPVELEGLLSGLFLSNETLDLSGLGITSLQGLQYLEDRTVVGGCYKYIDLHNNNIENISPIPTLLDLGFQGFDLSYNQIVDISPVAEYEHYDPGHKYKDYENKIILNNNKIERIPVLNSGCSLDLSYNNIKDIPASSILGAVNLSHNKIEDISSVSLSLPPSLDIGIFAVANADLSYNNIKDISSITSLVGVNLSHNQIEDISSLTSLHNVDLSYNSIKYISAFSIDDYITSPLSRNTKINLSHNQIENISPLKGVQAEYSHIEGWSSLDLSYNNISNIDDFSNYAGNVKIDLSYNYLDISENSPTIQVINSAHVLVSDMWGGPDAPFGSPFTYSPQRTKLNDPSTNISISEVEAGAIPEGAVLSVQHTTAGSNLALATTALDNLTSKFELYDITLKVDGKEVQPSGKITVKIPVPEGYSGSTAKIYRIEANGTGTSIPATFKDGYMVFELDRLSLYAIAEPADDTPSITRFLGNNRVTTANTIALEGWPTGSSTVILASGASFADALAAAPLAAHYDAPILLSSSKTTLEETVLSTINDLKAENVIIIGGESSVSKAIYTQLEGLNLKVERLAGGNRYTTAIEVAKALEADGLEFTSAFLADGTNFPDALSVSPVAGILQQPILFTNKGDAAKINDDTGGYIQSTGIKSVNIVGGGISDTVADNLKSAYGVTSTKRLSGSNRYATAVAINTEYKSIFTGGAVTLTTGANYPDALAGSAYSARIGAPLFLLQNGQTLSDVNAAIQELDPNAIYIYGGAINDDTVNNHF
ncbi:MAG: cell wall-binding repeat-containing protein [Oscillospiraceae bacterium]|jgi:internalin A|nr:cell wall-binding repeat-containing protein [Oscillospiraceae bacterium]